MNDDLLGVQVKPVLHAMVADPHVSGARRADVWLVWRKVQRGAGFPTCRL